jgi:hypothetical protein
MAKASGEAARGVPGQISGRPEISSLAVAASHFGVNLDLDDAELLDYAVTQFNRAAWTLAGSGLAFAELKRRMPHGEFLKALESRGISNQRAHEAMRVAELISKLPPQDAKRIASIPPSKAIELAKADPEVVEELLEDGTLDGSHPLSVRELRDRIEDLEQKNLRMASSLAAAEAHTEIFRRQAEQRANTEKTPPWYGAARAETIALTEQMALSLVELEKVANENIFGAPFRSDNEKTIARMAAGTVYHLLGGITAQAQQLLKRLVEDFGKEITGEREVRVCLLSGDELQRLIATRLELVRNMEADKEVRRQLRAAEQPRGRGRPKGSKNKSARR